MFAMNVVERDVKNVIVVGNALWKRLVSVISVIWDGNLERNYD
jgi:hypothetical protein